MSVSESVPRSYRGESGEEEPPAARVPRGFSASLSPEVRALEALLAGLTQVQAAERAGVSERTLRNWLRRPEFAGALADRRRFAMEEICNHLQQTALKALKELDRLVDGRSTHVSARQFAAIRFAIDSSLRGAAQLERLTLAAETARRSAPVSLGETIITEHPAETSASLPPPVRIGEEPPAPALCGEAVAAPGVPPSSRPEVVPSGSRTGLYQRRHVSGGRPSSAAGSTGSSSAPPSARSEESSVTPTGEFPSTDATHGFPALHAPGSRRTAA